MTPFAVSDRSHDRGLSHGDHVPCSFLLGAYVFGTVRADHIIVSGWMSMSILELDQSFKQIAIDLSCRIHCSRRL